MTTIATKNGVMAGDNLWTMGDTKIVCAEKIWISKRTDSVLGFSGDAAWLVMFKEWYESGAKRKMVPDIRVHVEGCIHALELTTDGKIWIWDIDFIPMPFQGEFLAVGSGSKYAMGAMAAGASARQAVSVACRLDPYSGLPVRWRKSRR